MVGQFADLPLSRSSFRGARGFCATARGFLGRGLRLRRTFGRRRLGAVRGGDERFRLLEPSYPIVPGALHGAWAKIIGSRLLRFLGSQRADVAVCMCLAL